MQTFTKVGLDALLTPENCALLLIDHQPSQLANVNSHEPTMVINNVTALGRVGERATLYSATHSPLVEPDGRISRIRLS